jgi:hypothetical protein
MTAHNLAVLSVVLETFQTYYAFSRAVNPIAIDAGEHWALVTQKRTRNMPLQLALWPISAHKGTRAFEFVKDLVLEVPRFR